MHCLLYGTHEDVVADLVLGISVRMSVMTHEIIALHADKALARPLGYLEENKEYGRLWVQQSAVLE